ncbi:ADP-ribosylglycohydrolase [Oleiphilus sp. HI0009]|uniref:ADP-ribosylglycohydrolase family protein n=1 Tax=unclassified Oleiphilus TaxID=2631174 RepID=UPI0007C2FE21|nr:MULTISPECIES: ADP-ribosylglycohydrolase family protein [unclassified Oleiphilus]KZX76140.1 ADP-ribosylglycohydrolase [Oleiphilus sp. HI0009]KZX77947.1 ADP-ribosylglycohydrolase [Oleiphilus sp. HI0009]KZY67939.1 ADP-ribosylglycohydrolase [Oleiphilus sp. HI0067]KZY71704.1 ADP-ribosylglycohydrolase [Oleiphilus sp. HI0066]KZY76556.1 ADP-ribosylglycohydrolase [Oleiphilus sp. HI0067]
MLSLLDRYEGCLLGLAVGDAIGTTLEFMPKGSFTPIDDMIGGGPFGLRAGQWTDDTSMALCLAESLIQRNGFDPIDQMNRYCNWWQWGYLSSTGECFDIGSTVVEALNKYLENKKPFAGSIEPDCAGNGSLMRLAPVPMTYYGNIDNVIKYAGESSRTTHGTAECIDACKYFADLLCLTLDGVDKGDLLNSSSYKPYTQKINLISDGRFLNKSEQEISGSGYVVHSLEAALWSFFTTDSYESAILKSANLGDDADTTAAICGQISGAYYGASNIKKSWLDKLHMHDEIKATANQLLELRDKLNQPS